MPSRKKIALGILIGFLVVFFGGLAIYFAPILFTNTTVDENGNPTRNINLFPFGGNGGGFDYDIFEDDDDDNQNNNNEQIGNQYDGPRQPQLRMISPGPVIGATMYPATGHSGLSGPATATTTDRNIANDFRYVELGTGHIYQGSTNTGLVERISNTTIPKINEAMFANADRVILRYTDDGGRIKTFSAELVNNFAEGSATNKRLQGVFLPDNILDVAISSEGKMLSLSGNPGDYRVYLSSVLGDNQTQVYQSPLGEWELSWNGNEREALIQSTPSYETFGMAYTLDTANGDFRPYITARKALDVVTTNDRDNALISFRADGQTRMFIWNRETNQYIDLGLSTFAQKCVWAENRAQFYCAIPIQSIADAEPDLWYQGVTSHSDEFWEIDPVTGRSRVILVPAGFTDETIDVIDLTLSDDEQFLYFRDKTARSLWSLQIDYERIAPSAPIIQPVVIDPSATSTEDGTTSEETETQNPDLEGELEGEFFDVPETTESAQ